MADRERKGMSRLLSPKPLVEAKGTGANPDEWLRRKQVAGVFALLQVLGNTLC